MKKKGFIYTLMTLFITSTVLTGCSLLEDPEFKDDTEAQVEFMENAKKAMSELGSYTLSGREIVYDDDLEQDIEYESTIKIKGQDSDYLMSSSDDSLSIQIISLGESEYYGSQDYWVRDTRSGDSVRNNVEKMFLNYVEADWDADYVEFKGEEDLDGVTTYKFKISFENTDNNSDETGHIWVEKEAKRIVKYEATGGKNKGFVTTFDYDTVVEIVAPTDFEDIS